MPEEEKLISEFNEAGFQISRLHNLYLKSQFLRERGRLIHCKWILDSIEVELWNDAKRLDGDKMKEEDKESYVSKIKKVDDELDKIIKEKEYVKLYLKLIEKEKLLKEIQDAAGKGARYKPADDDLM